MLYQCIRTNKDHSEMAETTAVFFLRELSSVSHELESEEQLS